ncbi:MAG: serine hydrolase domain-containing protein [Leptolyngbyaceae cyanobacterium]
MILSTSLQIAQNPIQIAELDAYLQAYYETNRFMGAAIVVDDGELVFSNSYGMANLEHQVPNSRSTKFRIGSITKQFTAAAILQLQDRGLLDVQDPAIQDSPET